MEALSRAMACNLGMRLPYVLSIPNADLSVLGSGPIDRVQKINVAARHSLIITLICKRNWGFLKKLDQTLKNYCPVASMEVV